jgi:hypothetical protein
VLTATEMAADREWRIPQRVWTELGRLLDAGRERDALDDLVWYYRYRGTPGYFVADTIRDFRLGRRSELPE